ncbi:MAG TPA: hypothetical protein VJ978_11405 [Nitriliruptoraceae bacterium]|nr:hypothetical protein [Nitriliruptoraceae bacterium]
MERTANAHVVAAAVDGLAELQDFRDAMEPDDAPFADQLRDLFTAAVAFYAAAVPLRSLLITDRVLADDFHDVARRTGLGPHLPILEVTAWMQRWIDAGEIHEGTDPRCAALMVCGMAHTIGDMRVVLPRDVIAEVSCCAEEPNITLMLQALTAAPARVPMDS